MTKKVTRALVSVSDKAGIVAFCRALRLLDIEILSTGGTAKLLIDNDVAVTEVSEYTDFPEMMEGRVKTLHPKIHGGILGRRGIDDDVMIAHDIYPIDMVVVNLYPFAQTIAHPECDLALAIENIDIGGPAMIRAAAKNYPHVAVLVQPGSYEPIIEILKETNGFLSHETRFELALKAFEHTSAYDTAIATYLSGQITDNPFPPTLNLQFSLQQHLRYGENPHQRGAFYIENHPARGSIAGAKQLQGKALSFNNIADADAALACVQSFTEKPTCVIVKHANPCGVAQADDLLTAYDLAYATDSTSAFGGIIAFNQELDEKTAQEIVDRQFVEVVIAPHVSDAAREVFAKKQNIRVLSVGNWDETDHEKLTFDYRRVSGGLLVQDQDVGVVLPSNMHIVSKRVPSAQEWYDLLFAWKIAKFVKSNAIVYCKNGQLIGVGAGQMSRLYSAKIAGIKAADAKLDVKCSVMASDAFFPFRDGIDAAAEVGITAIIHPGGSMRDQEVIDAANEFDMAMVFTGMRHFRH